nr:zinc finger protein 1-like [Ipomoea batatas]
MENNHEGDDDEVSLDLSLGCRDAAAANATAADGFQVTSPLQDVGSDASESGGGGGDRRVFSSLGIHFHSMIQKPATYFGAPSPFPGSSQMPSPSIYGYNAWTRRPFDQPPAIGRLAPESYHVGTRLPPSSSSSLPNTAMGRFDMPYRSPTVVDGIGDGYRMDIAGAGAVAGASSSKSQQEIDLDLSLKL